MSNIPLSIAVDGLVSVIIPTFNHGPFVSDAIGSVLGQTYRNVEIIIVDDGSTDNTREIVTQFGDQVRYIYQENRGLSAARNTGLRMARGDFIGLLDADDMYEPEFLGCLIPLLEADLEAGGVYCGYRFVDESNNPLPQREARVVPPEDFYQTLLEGNFLVPESMLVRRRCYDHVGFFDESLTACEDWDMWLRLAREYKIIGSDQLLTRHRVLPGSMSSDSARMIQNRLAVINKYTEFDPLDNPAMSSFERRVYGKGYLIFTVEQLQSGDHFGAFNHFCEMAKICPELLTELNTFYELGCSGQLKGYRGSCSHLDLEKNISLTFNFLDQLFNDTSMSHDIQKFRAPAYGNANLALGLLSYGSKKMGETRRFLLHAVAASPGLLLSRQFLPTYAKSLLGSDIINWLRDYKHGKSVSEEY